MYDLKKLFSTVGNNGLEKVRFYIGDKTKHGVNLIYLSDLELIKFPAKLENLAPEIKNGASFISENNRLRIFSYGIIPQNFVFRSHKVSCNTYYQWFKKVEKTKLKLSRKVIVSKNDQIDKSVFYDLTPVYTAFHDNYHKSEIIATKELIKIIDNITYELSKSYYKKDNYLVLDLNDFSNREYLFAFYNYYKLNKKLFNDISGIVVRVDGKYWPLTENYQDKDISKIKINMIVFNKIKNIKLKIDDEVIILDKNNNQEDSSDESKNTEDFNKSIKSDKSLDKSLEKLDSHYKNITRVGNVISDKDELEIKQKFEIVHNKIMRDKKLSGNFQERTASLLKKPEYKKYHKILNSLEELNMKYNGAIKVNRDLVKSTADTYFDPVSVLKIDTFHSYNKQQTEFDEVLDEAMFDLFKSLEQDPKAGIKVQDIKIKIEDNFKSRFKIYKIKIKNTKFGYKKPYDIELKVPYPVNGKYMKLDGINYIMSNQFFPRPILKTDPDKVKIYTHFGTAAVELKGTNLSKTSDFDRLQQEFLKILTELKVLQGTKNLSTEEVELLKEEFNIPDINPKLIFNLETK